MRVHDIDQFQRDLFMAAEFQRAVLPEDLDLAYLSSAILYRPSNHVSGDVYNFQLNREQEISVFLGDATGHGITAALMTMMVHLGLENFPGNLGTDEVLRSLNSMIARHDTGLSIAGQLFRISPDGTLRITHAGLPSLMILSNPVNEIKLFENGGCPIGMFTEEAVPYVEETRSLQDGDRVFACTDGLPDWKNRDGNSFGFDRLVKCLKTTADQPLSEIPESILDEVTTFAGDVPNHDDVTLLCFEYRAGR